MFQLGKQPTRACLSLITSLVLIGAGRSQIPQLGAVERLTVVTLALQVGATDRETKQVTYTPTPGWHVRSHEVVCTAKRGNSSYTVSTVPRDWNWLSEEDVRESYKAVIDLAGTVHGQGAEARYSSEQDDLLRELRKVRATHHALVVEATARGEGFLRGGGCVEFTVTAELAYLGTSEDVKRTAASHKATLGSAEKASSESKRRKVR